MRKHSAPRSRAEVFQALGPLPTSCCSEKKPRFPLQSQAPHEEFAKKKIRKSLHKYLNKSCLVQAFMATWRLTVIKAIKDTLGIKVCASVEAVLPQSARRSCSAGALQPPTFQPPWPRGLCLRKECSFQPSLSTWILRHELYHPEISEVGLR